MEVDLEPASMHRQLTSMTANKIEFYVSRLMDLLPAIEAVLEVQHIQREGSTNSSLNKQTMENKSADPLMVAKKRNRREKIRHLKLNFQRMSSNENPSSQMDSASR